MGIERAFNPPERSTLEVEDEFAAWEAAAATTAQLRLEDGKVWEGWSFGHGSAVAGEVVFSTGMVGYPESLTDPSFAGQILVMTYPLVGNYGVPDESVDQWGLPVHFEGAKIFPKAVVVADYSFTASHCLASKTLSSWLKANGVPAIFGVDTRAITKYLRHKGSALGAVVVGKGTRCPPWDDPNARNLVAEVSIGEPRVFDPPEGPNSNVCIVAVDCGMKYNIIRYFVNHLGVRLKVVPWDYDFTCEDFDGLFLSNGPGNPENCQKTIEHIQRVMEERPSTPIWGICLGNQLLALAAGAKTYKMKFGNRGMNQPCVDLRTGRCYITSQNHGFAVDEKTLPSGWVPLFTNANDGSNEGIAHARRPWLSVQFHPEACGGPTDTSFLFDEFLQIVQNNPGRSLTTIKYKHPTMLSKVLVLGSGGLTIGQAGEFDYSGSQAIKALREQGVQSVLINPNIATVQTSKGLADQIYFLPVTPEFVTKVIEKVRPDGLFAAFGGQTALNCAVQLHKDGTLEKYGVQVLGTQIESIIATEDREIFAKQIESIGEKVAESACANTLEEAREVAERIGYPVLVRAAFALGGLGSGFADNQNELDALCKQAFVNSPQVIIDECLKGWKELEYEVMRDHKDNGLVVCNMENFDPMGIHTGDSVVVAPSQTLSNEEYNQLRETAIKVIRHFGIVGEANIQYALCPSTGKVRIVEVNARLSRSSALASKATGFPLAYVAAKIALGHDLVNLRNMVTRSTTACFEPALDYCVVKIPRWDTDKFPTVFRELGTQMKSVGEVMSIGRTFPEAVQKAMRMVADGSVGFDEALFKRTQHAKGTAAVQKEVVEKGSNASLEYELSHPGPLRLWAIAHAFKEGYTAEKVHQLTKCDRWFLSKLYACHSTKKRLESLGGLQGLEDVGPDLLRRVKQMGFCDKQIASALGDCDAAEVMKLRDRFNVRPSVKQVDTLAAEFPAQTNYLYLTYHGDENDVQPLNKETLPGYKDSLHDSAFGKGRLDEEHHWEIPIVNSTGPILSRKPSRVFPAKDTRKYSVHGGGLLQMSFAVLGSGCYRIGASVEFDWGCVSAVRTLRQTGHRAMVINCNPETVSTDYDESDRLYFEELSLETVLEICHFEDPTGVIVSLGGQTPNNLAPLLADAGVPIMGTPASSIDKAEDRSKFSQMCDSMGIDQPEWSQFHEVEEAAVFAKQVKYPVLVRPSYVLSGAAMRVIESEDGLRDFLQGSSVVEQEHPVVISKYISGAREIEFDAVGARGTVINYAISEHIEDAGTHSGDATLLLPAQRLHLETHRRVMHIAKQLCRELNISGPFNVQFMAQEGGSNSQRMVQVIECNLRASRTVPFVSKALNVDFVELSTRIMLGQVVKPVPVHLLDFDFVACKVPMFSFTRLSHSDPRVGVEMQSTGEVACFGADAHEALLKGMISAGLKCPPEGCGVLLSFGAQEHKQAFVPYIKQLAEMGHQLYATPGTHASIEKDAKLPVKLLHNAVTQRRPNCNSAIEDGSVKMVITTPSSRDSEGVTAGYFLRRHALEAGVALLVDLRQAMLVVDALYAKHLAERDGKDFWSTESWHDLHRLA